MTDQIFYSQVEWAIGLGLFLGLMLAAEGGFRLGGWRRNRIGDAAKSQTTTVQGAVLGLMGLLAGFSLAMAVGRFDARRQLVVEESNAIGTCYLRTSLLPEPYAEETAGQLRAYLDERIEYSVTIRDQTKAVAAQNEARRLLNGLWRKAAEASEAAPTVMTALFVESLNEVIDVEAKRSQAMNSHVPLAVMVMLFVSAAFSALFIGYMYGDAGQRNLFATAVATALFSLVIMIIIDLDHPRAGLVKLSQKGLIELREGLDPPTGESPNP